MKIMKKMLKKMMKLNNKKIMIRVKMNNQMKKI